ncbi:MAG: alpha/beta fold hydrolase [Magnetococcales bacterium]|nr:alpha/beta fold hydrolase [Magnetococcales bacterium]
MIKWLLGLLLALLLLQATGLYLWQETMIFLTRPLREWQRQAALLQRHRLQEVSLHTHDGVTVRGWWLLPRTVERAPLLIYFGGNAEEVSHLLSEADRFAGWSLLLCNYRGYGGSEGVPGEKALVADAVQLYDHFSAQPSIDGQRVVLLGRSLGSGVAVQLAAARPVAATILLSPFDSLREVAQSIYFWLPVRWLLRHPFDSLAKAGSIRSPLLVVLGERDTLVPPAMSERLAQAWGGPTQVYREPFADHDTLLDNGRAWQAIVSYLQRLPG